MSHNIVIVSPEDIVPDKYRRVEFVRELSNKLNCALVMPNESHSYSLAVEYMKEWFLSGFVDGYFRSVYVNEKNIIDDFRTMTKEQLFKRPKPCCTIIPRADYEFNRENLDLYNYGSSNYINRARYQDSFLRDFDKNIYLSADFKMKKVNFTFRAKVQTLAVAQNMAEHDKIRFRANGTQGKNVDLDYLIPDQLIHALATDVGFTVNEDGTIEENTEFLCYLNQHSLYPIMHKFTSALGRYQYFLKVPNMYMHIKTNDITIDEGNRKGHVVTDYNVEFESELLMPAPKFFAYYTMEKKEFIKVEERSGSYTLYSFPISNIPTSNSKGWQQYLSTFYEDDHDNFMAKKPLEIYFDELMGDLRNVIAYTKSLYLSPSLFIDFKLFNDGSEVKIHVDWESLRIYTDTPMTNSKSYLVMYVDTNYLHEKVIEMKKQEDERITPYLKAKNIRGKA